MTKPNFQTIPQFTKQPTYRCDISWKYLEIQLSDWFKIGLDIDPDFQRAHVWTKNQQIKYVEYILQGGNTGKDLFFNCENWTIMDGLNYFVLVDGKQRLEAVRLFMGNKLKAFGHLFKEFEGKTGVCRERFTFNVNDLFSKKEVLNWYLEMNTTGTPHTKKEIKKVERMLKKEEE